MAMITFRGRVQLFGAAFVTLFVLACGDGPPAGDSSIAKALSYESKERAAAEAAEARREAEAKVRIEAEKAAKAKLEAELDKVAIVPDDAPEKLDEACEALMKAYDAFMKRATEMAVYEWTEDHLKKLGQQRVNCIKRANLDLANCQTHALANAPAGFDGHEGPETARHVMVRCIEKFGEEAHKAEVAEEKRAAESKEDAPPPPE
jgi:hypothetical protein